MTPTARTLDRLRKEGWKAAVVEHWNPHAKIRQDLFGCIDVVAVRPGEMLGVQATTTSNQANRMAKLAGHDGAVAWLASGARLEVWGWTKRKLKRGGKAMRWEVTRRNVDCSELPQEPSDGQ